MNTRKRFIFTIVLSAVLVWFLSEGLTIILLTLLMQDSKKARIIVDQVREKCNDILKTLDNEDPKKGSNRYKFSDWFKTV